MARIRTVKPEFWEDPTIGLLTTEARLLFIATWNLADDEGILRWSPPYIKASVFMYDNTDLERVGEVMEELVKHELIFTYTYKRQDLALIVNFAKHQRINRPTPSRLDPPNWHMAATLDMYCRRDGGVCHLCGGEVMLYGGQGNPLLASLDHLVPQSQGGTDHPSNLKVAHHGCNKARCDRPIAEFTGPPTSVVTHLERLRAGAHGGVSESFTEDSPPDREVEGKGSGGELTLVDASADETEPVPTFDEFWQAYPRHSETGQIAGGGAKQPALKRWNRLKPDEKRACMVAVAHYRTDVEARGAYVKHPEGWLNERRWEDLQQAPPPPRARGKPPVSTHDDEMEANRHNADYWTGKA